MAEIEKMNLESLDIVNERLDRMRELFPEVFSEKGIDFDKLRLELGDEVDDGDERYAFTWPGKRDAIRQAQTPSCATLRPCLEKSRSRIGKDRSFDSGNIYIEGDNLEVLKLLQRAYHGKVKVIFIDPPYNTGHDFVYIDSFNDSIQNYRSQMGLDQQSNADTSGRFHSNWCSMIYPRIKLGRELLSDDGIMVITIDDNEYSNLKTICDEIFGQSNCLATLVWQKTLTRRNDAKQISSAHDYILIYSKSSDSVEIKPEPPTEKQRATYTNRDNDLRGDWLAVPFHAPNIRPNLTYPIVLPSGRTVMPPKGRCWSTSKENFDALVADGRIWFGKDGDGMPQRKKYWNERDKDEGVVPWTWWSYDFAGENREATKEIKDLFDDAAIFSAPKPVKLISRVLDLIETDDAIILDFFSGSATTAQAVFEKNIDGGGRTFLMVQVPERCPENSVANELGYLTLCDVGEERIRRAGDEIKAEVEESNRQPRLDEEPKRLPDIGFRVFKLDDSGIQKPDPGQLLVDCVKPDRSDLDIVFEMMLKWGLELTLPVEKEELAGYPCYTVAYGELMCCLAPGLTIDTLEAIAEIEPRRVFILDSILDDSLKLNAVQIFKRVEERTGREVELRTV